jgi:hypothetical protein
MAPKEKESLSEMQAYVMHLRYRLERYRFYGIIPPAIFLVELKMAERLAKLDLKEDRRIDVKI